MRQAGVGRLILRLELFEDGSGDRDLMVDSIPRARSADYPYASGSLRIDPSQPLTAPRVLTFREKVPSPFTTQVLDRADGSIYTHVYRPLDSNRVFDLHAKNLATFTRFFRDHGDTCAGSFTIDELGPDWVAEWYSVDMNSRDEYFNALAAVELPMDIQRIVDAGRLLQTQSSLRYFFWLTPK